MEVVSSTRRIQRVRHEIKQREVEVDRISLIGANFVSITFKGEALADFISDSFDDHVKFIFTNAAGETVRRDYTPRAYDRQMGEVTIEFVCHGEGDATKWAQQAKAGQRAIIAGPRGSMIVPMNYSWHLLAGDATALPAIHRRLEELPDGARAFVIVQVDDPADVRQFHSEAQVQVQWVATQAELLDAVRTLQLPPGHGFAWAAGEATTMAQLREILVTEKAHPKEAMKIAAYWKHGASDFHQKLD
jgi:NADPH-dependent ferric siderophore reductase